MGAVHLIWDNVLPAVRPIGGVLLDNMPDASDRRDTLGKERGGRAKAADIAERVHALALQK